MTSDNDGGTYYFGYGPMVHPTVRHRRGIEVVEAKPAILRNHRLTFAYGGVASVVPQRGYEIHGIVMKCKTAYDWEKLQKSEGGYYATELDVHPYSNNTAELPVFDPDVEEEDDVPPIRAKVFIMLEFDQSKLEKPLERIPQERYLRIIAAGMQKYNVSEDYIQDEIMNVPFSPSRKPGNYSQFSALHLQEARDIVGNEETDPESDLDGPLPRINWEGYQRLCNDAIAAGSEEHPKHLYFIVGQHVIFIQNHPGKTHPGAMWHFANAFMKKDVTFYLHQTHFDPDIPNCETEADVTKPIQAWAENLLVHSIAQGLSAFRVFEFSEREQDNVESNESVHRMRAFLAGPKRRPRNRFTLTNRFSLTNLTHKLRKDLKVRKDLRFGRHSVR